MADRDTAQTLLDLERRGWDSLCDGTGSTFYGDLMTDDGLMVLADGSVMDKDTLVASLEHGPTWQSYDIDDLQVVDAGDEAAAVVYVGTGYRDGDQPAFIAVMSSLYVRQDGRWRLALYQQTPTSP